MTSLNLVPIVLSVVSICISYLIIQIFLLYWNSRRVIKFGNKFPGPKTVPLFGNALLCVGSPIERLQTLFDEFYAHGRRTMRAFMCWDLYVFVRHPEDVQIVLNKILAKSKLYTLTEHLTGSGIWTAPLPKWKRNRKILNPAFNTKMLKDFIEIYNAKSKILVDSLKDFVNGPEIDLFSYTTSCTMNMIMNTSIGNNFNAHEDWSFVQRFNRALAIFADRMYTWWQYVDFIFFNTRVGKESISHTSYVHEVIYKIIRERREVCRNKTILENGNNENDSSSAEISNSSLIRKAILDHVLDGKNEAEQLSDEQIRDEITTLLFAGTDTSGLTTAFLLMILGMYPDIQEKCFQEVYKIFGNSERDVESEDLIEMKYLEQCIKETMRLFPPVSIISRLALEDVQISDGIIPAGGNAVIFIHGLHRDPVTFPDPDKFEPDRFLPENVKNLHPYSFIPFSAGPRNCIGMKYAMMSMLTMMSHVLRRYHVLCDKKFENIVMKLELMSKPVDGFPVRLVERQSFLSERTLLQ